MNSAILPRVAPFILFMAFVGLEEAARFLGSRDMITLSRQTLQYLYPLKVISVAALLIAFRKQYPEIVFRQLLIPLQLAVALSIGVAVFFLWIQMDFSVSPSGAPQGFNPLLFDGGTERTVMIIMRLAGAVLVVPVMEELFWRSFLIRYLVDSDFSKVPIGAATWPSFLISSLLFGLEHTLFLAGVMAGIAYNLLLYYTRSIAHCILAHALTNLLLGIYVLITRQWHFW